MKSEVNTISDAMQKFLSLIHMMYYGVMSGMSGIGVPTHVLVTNTYQGISRDEDIQNLLASSAFEVTGDSPKAVIESVSDNLCRVNWTQKIEVLESSEKEMKLSIFGCILKYAGDQYVKNIDSTPPCSVAALIFHFIEKGTGQQWNLKDHLMNSDGTETLVIQENSKFMEDLL